MYLVQLIFTDENLSSNFMKFIKVEKLQAFDASFISKEQQKKENLSMQLMFVPEKGAAFEVDCKYYEDKSSIQTDDTLALCICDSAKEALMVADNFERIDNYDSLIARLNDDSFSMQAFAFAAIPITAI